jgi:hypothetical protein
VDRTMSGTAPNSMVFEAHETAGMAVYQRARVR